MSILNICILICTHIHTVLYIYTMYLQLFESFFVRISSFIPHLQHSITQEFQTFEGGASGATGFGSERCQQFGSSWRPQPAETDTQSQLFGVLENCKKNPFPLLLSMFCFLFFWKMRPNLGCQRVSYQSMDIGMLVYHWYHLKKPFKVLEQLL